MRRGFQRPPGSRAGGGRVVPLGCDHPVDRDGPGRDGRVTRINPARAAGGPSLHYSSPGDDTRPTTFEAMAGAVADEIRCAAKALSPALPFATPSEMRVDSDYPLERLTLRG